MVQDVHLKMGLNMIKILNNKDAGVGYTVSTPVIQVSHCLTARHIADMVRELAKIKGSKFVRELVEVELEELEPAKPVPPAFYNYVEGNVKPKGGYTMFSALHIALTEARRLATMVAGRTVYTCKSDGTILHKTHSKTEIIQCQN